MESILCVTVKFNAHPIEISCRSSRFYCGSVLRPGIALSGKRHILSLRCRMLSRASQVNEEQSAVTTREVQDAAHQQPGHCYHTVLGAQPSRVSPGLAFFPTDILGSNPYKCKIKYHLSSQHNRYIILIPLPQIFLNLLMLLFPIRTRYPIFYFHALSS